MWRRAGIALVKRLATNHDYQKLNSFLVSRSFIRIPLLEYPKSRSPFGCLTIPSRQMTIVRKRTKRYKTPRSKKKAQPCKERRLIPAPSLHRKPPNFVRRSGKLTAHEREHEKFKQVLGRLEIKQLAWKDGNTEYGKDEKVELRRAADRCNPFETIPTFRKKSDCGPPPISMKKRKGAITISRITFDERTRGVGKIKGVKDQKRLFRRAKRPAILTTDKRDED